MKNRVPFTGRARRGRRPSLPLAGCWSVLAVLLFGSAARAQPLAVPQPVAPDVIPAYAQAVLDGTVIADPNVTPAGCATCGPLPAILPSVSIFGDGVCACSDGDTCNSCACKPGMARHCPLDPCPPDGYFGRLLHGLAACVCCPDPCYDPVWVTTANSAFFLDTVRPRTYTRFRWDLARNVILPDRAEYLWARTPASGRGRGPQNAETRLHYDELSLYQEVAAGNFAFFIETTYRSVYPDNNPHHANFGDINLGTKSLLIDCELWQFAFQFRTYIPTGNPRNGLGTGHTALEPSVLSSLKLAPDIYLQSQLAYWIPIGGDQDYQGAVWRYGFSVNSLLYKWNAWELISTSEFNGLTFTDGALTVPGPPVMTVSASGETYLYAGGGLRLVFCENTDFGFGATFALTDDHFARELYRFEFRKRY